MGRDAIILSPNGSALLSPHRVKIVGFPNPPSIQVRYNSGIVNANGAFDINYTPTGELDAGLMMTTLYKSAYGAWGSAALYGAGDCPVGDDVISNFYYGADITFGGGTIDMGTRHAGLVADIMSQSWEQETEWGAGSGYQVSYNDATAHLQDCWPGLGLNPADYDHSLIVSAGGSDLATSYDPLFTSVSGWCLNASSPYIECTGTMACISQILVTGYDIQQYWFGRYRRPWTQGGPSFPGSDVFNVLGTHATNPGKSGQFIITVPYIDGFQDYESSTPIESSPFPLFDFNGWDCAVHTDLVFCVVGQYPHEWAKANGITFS